jgi:hypothetical protein
VVEINIGPSGIKFCVCPPVTLEPNQLSLLEADIEAANQE